jgi:hypothetical protein
VLKHQDRTNNQESNVGKRKVRREDEAVLLLELKEERCSGNFRTWRARQERIFEPALDYLHL